MLDPLLGEQEDQIRDAVETAVRNPEAILSVASWSDRDGYICGFELVYGCRPAISI